MRLCLKIVSKLRTNFKTESYFLRSIPCGEPFDFSIRTLTHRASYGVQKPGVSKYHPLRSSLNGNSPQRSHARSAIALSRCPRGGRGPSPHSSLLKAVVCIYRYRSGIYHLFDSFGKWYGIGKCGIGIKMFDCLIVSAAAASPGRALRRRLGNAS